MQLDEIKQHITSLDAADLDKYYQRFSGEQGNGDLEKFIHYLYASGKISKSELKEVVSLSMVELSGVDNLKTLKIHSSGQTHDAKPVPEQNDNYPIVESIDAGAMGEISIARDKELGRNVAYKQIHMEIATDPNLVGRFYQEAQIIAQLDHPNIVPIYCMQISSGRVGYIMKLIQGETLKEIIGEARKQIDDTGTIDEAHSLPILLDHFLKICDAIHYAHRKGVIHRDLKPVNVMVGKFHEVYVMDWGISKLITADKIVGGEKTRKISYTKGGDSAYEATEKGQILGTPNYMSPEQACGMVDTLDHKSDQFSLGLILYELVTLEKAIRGGSLLEIMENATRGQISPMQHYSKKYKVPAELAAIIRKATSLEPEQRFASVDELARDIRHYIRGEPIVARKENLLRRAARSISNHIPLVLFTMFLVVIASLVTAALSLYRPGLFNTGP